MTSSLSRWACTGANVIGRSHQWNTGRCEDHWSKRRRNCGGIYGEVVAACVCDGAGSVPFGHVGASVVSSTLTKWLVRNFPFAHSGSTDDIKAKLMPYLISKLSRVAKGKKTSLRNFATTIVAVAVAENGSGMVIHLGDGGIIGRFGSDLRPICVPMKGEFANETYFVSDRDAADRIRILRWGPGDGCDGESEGETANGYLLFSDGLETSLLHRTTLEVAPAASTMLSWLDKYPEVEVGASVERNLNEVFRLRTMDDCTLVLMSNISGCTNPYPEPRSTLLPQATADEAWMELEPPADLSWFA